MAAAKAMLLSRIKEILAQACITDIDEDDPTRAGVVVISDYKGQSGNDRIILVVLDSHPTEEFNWTDEMKDHKTDLGFEVPPASTNGRKSHTYRATVKVMVNLSRDKELSSDDAMNIRQEVLHRARNAMQTCPTLKGFRDDFDVLVHAFNVARVLEYKLVGNNYVAYIDWAAFATMPNQ